MMATGIAYIIAHLIKLPSIERKEEVNKEMRFRLYGSFVVCVLYLILINTLGYLVASFIFFILEFRILGIKSWPFNVLLSAFISVAYYFVFIKYCSMVFPRGLLF
jgi:putative tricarboxylic transport membrane protein